MRTRKLAAGVLAVLLSMPTASAQQPAYRLGVQDRLRIHVHEWPALTGEFMVGANGNVVLPLIGEVKADGATTAEMAAAIGDRLRARSRLSLSPEAVVDVAQYRPFYIVGGVERPGEYAYRPGLIVLKAVSIAGGFYRAPRPQDWSLERDAINAAGDLKVAGERVLELKAREIRLGVEATDAVEMPVPAAGIEPRLAAFLGEEARVFNAGLERHRNQIASYESSIALAENEIVSLTAQSASVVQQHDAAIKEAADTKQRVSKGISQKQLVLPLERTIAQLEREKKELESGILRTRQQINLYKREIRELVDKRRSTALTDLQTLKALMKEAEAKVVTARRLVESSQDPSVKTDTSVQDQISVRYFIVREASGVSEEVEVGETTAVQPGNVVKVVRDQPVRGSTKPAPEKAAAASTPNGAQQDAGARSKKHAVR